MSGTRLDWDKVERPAPARVFLLTSEHLAWAGVRQGLADAGFIEIIGESREPARALAVIVAATADGLVMPSTLPGMDTAAFVQTLHHRCPHCRVVLIGDDLGAEQVTPFDGLAVYGCFTWQQLEESTLRLGVLTALSDSVAVVSSTIWEALLAALQRLPEPAASPVQLTARERVIVEGLDAGRTPAELATACRVSTRTIAREIDRLLEKFATRSLVHLGREAQRQGLL